MISVSSDRLLSAMGTVFDGKITYDNERIQPGMHSQCPLANYPCVVTDVLEKGEYYMASWFYLSSERKSPEPPKVELDGNVLHVDGKKYILD